jgi:hypothetical protein
VKHDIWMVCLPEKSCPSLKKGGINLSENEPNSVKEKGKMESSTPSGPILRIALNANLLFNVDINID